MYGRELLKAVLFGKGENMFKKKETSKSVKKKQTKEKKNRKKKIRVVKVGVHRKSVIFLWVLLIGSVSFGIYKNFTAIDKHTVHEKEVIQQNVLDTNGLESYVKDFAKIYHSWANNKEALESRKIALAGYLTDSLQQLNADAIRSDVPTIGVVDEVQIWDITKTADCEYTIVYKIKQTVMDNGQNSIVENAYETVVYMDSNGEKIIIKNPTIYSVPGKADYQPKELSSDMNVKADEQQEITEFLTTFFKLYPTAGEKELAYYAKNEVMKPISCENFVFSEIANLVFAKVDDGIEVNFTVKYLDQITKTTQLAQYDLILEKNDNWLIVKSK